MRTHLLDERLGNPELVDSGPQDALGPIDCVGPGVGRHRAFGIVHLEDEVHPPLKVETERDLVGDEIADTHADQRQNDDDPAAGGFEHLGG